MATPSMISRLGELNPKRCMTAFGLAFCLTLLSANQLLGQDSNGDPEEPQANSTAFTTSDPQIPLTHLKLLLKPLTREELIVETEAWRGLLRSLLIEISNIQIAINKQKVETNANAAPAEQAKVSQQELDALLRLQDDRSGLIERTNAAIDALERKGGDVEGYRQYVSISSGIDFKSGDASTTWSLFWNWLTSDQGGKRWLWNFFEFGVILASFYIGASFLSGLARHGASRVKGASKLLVNFVGSFVKQVLMVIGFIVALAALEVNTAPLLAAVGATGFVVGLALQGTLSNFASGLLILFYRPFDVGDVIDAGGVSGIVSSVTLVSTHVRTFDNKVMIVPNNDIWGGTITNASASKTRRIDMVFGIGYQDDIDKAKSVLESVVSQHPLVLKDPAPVVEVNELADSSVNFICRPWADNQNYWKVYWEITKMVKNEFDRNGISIPFPQRDVHVYQQSSDDAAMG